jgi:hypothetical protein
VATEKVVELSAVEVILDAGNNHLNSAKVCNDACIALAFIALTSEEHPELHPELLIGLDCGAALAKVRKEWLDDDDVQTQVLRLTKLFAAEMKWPDIDEGYLHLRARVSAAQRKSSRAITVVYERKKSHNARTDASTATVASPQMNAQVTTERDSTVDAISTSTTEHEESTSNAEPEDQIQSIGTLIQDFFHSDNITFDATLHALRVDFVKNSTKWDHVVAVGGCFAVVPIMWLFVKEMIRWSSTESV